MRSSRGPLRRLGAALPGVVLALCCAPTVWAGQGATGRELLERGLEAFRRGALEEAVSSWSEAARSLQARGSPAELTVTLLYLAQGYSTLGRHQQAVSSLESALNLAQGARDTPRTASALAGLGNEYLAIGAFEDAAHALGMGLELAAALGDQALQAVIQNIRGNLFTTQEKYGDAVGAYRKSIDLATRAGDTLTAARAGSNIAAALRKSGAPAEAKAELDTALSLLSVPGTGAFHDVAFALVNIGLGYRDLRTTASDPRDVVARAARAFDAAGTMAERIGDRRVASYAWGYRGTLEEEAGRDARALYLTQKAIFAAQQAGAPESLYRWQWQDGRLRWKSGAIDKAISAYRSAVHTVQAIRPELGTARAGQAASFRETIGRLYFELVDLLLRRAAAMRDLRSSQAYLVESRDVVELFKVAELRDYFRDECVDLALAKARKLDVVSPAAAVVYPILLPDRVELLVSLATGLERVPVGVGAERLTEEVRRFRRLLEKRTTFEYLRPAQQLYDWLIRPLERDLERQHVETLVFVPDGPLRTIPMAALHDGKQFLIARYSLAITPGLDLTDPRPIEREHAKVLAVGLTEPVQGFPELPYVSRELDAIRSLFGTTTLVDRDFLVSKLEEELREGQYSIVHIASHAEFRSDVDSSFLLTFDGRVSMDRLKQLVGLLRFRDEPLELLTLSACDTAAGDDRAALGLAGVAVKAGARSAVATLWRISDEASAELVAEFYRQLKQPGISRAVALRRAQLRMLSDSRYQHPVFWSPFILINNWL